MKKVRWMLNVHQNLVLLLSWFVVQQWCVDDEGPLRITDTDYCIGSVSQRSLALVPRQFSKPTWTTPNSQFQKFTYRQVLFTLIHQIRFLCPNAWIRVLRVISGQLCNYLRVGPPYSHRPSVKSQGNHVLTRRHHRDREEFRGKGTDTTIQSQSNVSFSCFVFNASSNSVHLTAMQCSAFWHLSELYLSRHAPYTGIHANSLSSPRLWVYPRDMPVSHVSVGE